MPNQFDLALEDLETAMAVIHAEDEADAPFGSRVTKPRAINRGSLPKYLSRVEEVIEPESLVCACGGCLHCIGEDVSERLDVVPAQFRVIVTRRPKYACRACTDGVVQAPAPARLIQAGLAEDGVKRIGELYRIEAELRFLNPDARLAGRQEQSAPLVCDMQARPPPRPCCGQVPTSRAGSMSYCHGIMSPYKAIAAGDYSV
jgi:transposase